MGVHGPMMVHFSEEFREITYFQMDPEINSGYGARLNEGKTRGVVHMYSAPPTAEGVKLRDVGHNLVIEKKPFLWARKAIDVGWFVDDGLDVYRVLSQNRWDFEASMTIHGLERVVGDNGTDTVNPAFYLGGDSLG